MKNEEFYSKSKTKDRILVEPIITKKNWWVFVALTLLTIFIEPVILMKYRKLIFSSWQEYFQQAVFIAQFLIPLEILILWLPQIRQVIIQRRGFDWIGKFEVKSKGISLGFHYLTLYPGNVHRLKVEAPMFYKTKVGDHLYDKTKCVERCEGGHSIS